MLVFGLAFSSYSAEPAPKKKLLLVTDSGGFIHDSVGLAEDILKEVCAKHNIEVTCYRYTRNPEDKGFAAYAKSFRERTGKPVEKEHCGRVNAETLKKFDAVLFFTTGNPLTKEETKDLVEWVKAGGAFSGTHCATDTLYGEPTYGELVGAYFVNHPWHQKIKLKVEDPNHAAGKAFKQGDEITDEIYQFRDSPYSREKLHIILSVDNSSIQTSIKNKDGVDQIKRADKDFAIAWCHEVGKGRSFYTSLGHRKEVWKDERFQDHLINGIKWTLKLVEGDATPSAKLPK
jgi:type 1 glutamine amidotransferase